MEDFDIVIPDEFKKLYKESGPIIKVPHQILRQKTSPVIKFGHKLKQTIKVMKKTMEDHRGLGLAAPQVGIGKQICLAYTPWDGSEVLINPLITAYSDEVIEAEEGCLSIPGWHRPARWQGSIRRGRAAGRACACRAAEGQGELRDRPFGRGAARKFDAGPTCVPALRRLRRLRDAAPGCAGPGGDQAARARRRAVAHRPGPARNRSRPDPWTLVGLSLPRATDRSPCRQEGRGAGRLPRTWLQLRRRHARVPRAAARSQRPAGAAARTGGATEHPRSAAADRTGRGRGGACQRERPANRAGVPAS